MSEKKVIKKQEATKSKATGTKKKKSTKACTTPRNEKGQFIKGESGNPGGRPKLSDEFKNYAEKSPAELWKIVQDPETGKTLKASICMWFGEMYFGKARQQVDMKAEGELTDTVKVSFEGDVAEWSE